LVARNQGHGGIRQQSKKTWMRWWGQRLIIATLVLVVSVLASSAAAEPSAESDAPPGGSADPQGAELPNLRTATSDTYLLPSGKRETRLFQTPVNYRNEDGDWQPIDESLEVQSDGTGLTNGPNDFDLSLPERLGSEPVRLAMDAGWVSSTLIGANSESAQLEGAVATYEAASPGTSFELTSISNGVKENIELAGPSEPRIFRFILNASPGVKPGLTEQGGVEFRNQVGDVVAEMPAPTLRDSSQGPGSESEDARYELEAVDAGWILTVDADSPWVSSPERVWPITIDPTTTKRTLGDDCTVQFLEPSNSSSTTCATANAATDQILYKREGETTRRRRSCLQIEGHD
jgi:hypothetical protein